MAFTTTIPIHIVKLPFQEEHELFAICDQYKIIRLGDKVEVLSGKYVEAIQQEIFNQGNHQTLFDYPITEQVELRQETAQFPAARNGYSFPELELQFDLVVQHREESLLIFVPAIGLEVFVPEDEYLSDRVGDAIRQEFGRKHRLRYVQRILSTIWYGQPELNTFEEKVKLLSPKEMTKKKEEDEKLSLLKKVTDPLKFSSAVAFEREAEMKQVMTGVRSEFARSILILGPGGSGKTALFQELAYQLNKQKKSSDPYPVLQTSASRLIKDLTEGSGWQSNMAILCQQLAQTQQLLYLGNLLELFEVGKYEGNDVSMASFMLNYISRQEIAVLAECTLEEKNLIEQRSPTFLQFFRIIEITEPEKDRLFKMVQHRTKILGRQYGVSVTSDGIDEAIRLNKRFQPYSGFPSKPVRMLEGIQRFQANAGNKGNVNQQTVYQFFCSDTGMPRFMVDPEIAMDMDAVLQDFQTKLFGQKPAVKAVVDVLGRIKAGVARRGKPLGSFLFVGPTGVGKTELAKNLAEFMFGNRDRMTRFDMSEYSHPGAVMRLTGFPGEDGVLTSAVRQQPFGVLLFDEIEKADKNFFDLLLQILDEGRLTDSRGQLVDFCSCLIIMTSNIGATSLSMNPVSIGRQRDDEEVAQSFIRAVENHFRPELYNRIGMVVPFYPLNQEVIEHITKREVGLILGQEGVRYRDMTIFVEDEVYGYLAKVGYDKTYGARYLKRTLLEQFTTPLSRQLNQYPEDYKLVVTVSVNESETGLQFEILAFEPDIEEYYDQMDFYFSADDASNIRRAFFQIQEGSVVLGLESERYQLQRELERVGQVQFYQNPAKPTRLNQLNELLGESAKLGKDIQQLEEEIALQILKDKGGNDELLELIKTWKADRDHHLIRLYETNTALSDRVRFMVFSLQLEPFLEFYFELFSQMPFEVYGKSIWYHKPTFDRLKLEEEQLGKSQMLYLPSREVYIEDYEKINLKVWDTPPEKGAQKIGMQFVIKGRLAQLYFMQEVGLWEWPQKNTKARAALYAQPTNEEYALPDNLQVRSGYQGTPRRTYRDDQFKDTPLGINRALNVKDAASMVARMLKTRADQLLLKELG